LALNGDKNMNKVIVVLLAGILFGCGTDVNDSGEDADSASKNEQNACTELGVIPISDNSRRIEILKSHGFSTTQANDFERLMAQYHSVSQAIDRQSGNMYKKQAASRNRSCLDQHSLDCTQLWTQLENGASGEELDELSSQPLLECMGQ
jgi:hypothetical protein